MSFTDRYDAMGIVQPDPVTMCLGACEGTGYVPVKGDVAEGIYLERWKEAEAEKPSDDGWHFIVCPDCNGTRIRVTEDEMKLREKEIAEELSASEALFAFMGWLTGRAEKVSFGSIENCSVAVDLVGEFCRVNRLAVPRNDFPSRFQMPDENFVSSIEKSIKEDEKEIS